jgi:hypothetical protein
MKLLKWSKEDKRIPSRRERTTVSVKKNKQLCGREALLHKVVLFLFSGLKRNRLQLQHAEKDEIGFAMSRIARTSPIRTRVVGTDPTTSSHDPGFVAKISTVD